MISLAPERYLIVEKIRACPICPNCGSKKFDRITSNETVVKCVKCGKELVI
jgi:ribosomal protein L37AE/L43A